MYFFLNKKESTNLKNLNNANNKKKSEIKNY